MKGATTIVTYTGRSFDLIKPRPEMVTLYDIAVALSRLARFNGHTIFFYSVAEHCVRMAREQDSIDMMWHCLMHDAAEAYVGDITHPTIDAINARTVGECENCGCVELEESIGEVKKWIEQDILLAIYNHFTYERVQMFAIPSYDDREDIKSEDLRMLATERRDICKVSQYDKAAWEWSCLKGVDPYPTRINLCWEPDKAKQVFLDMAERLIKHKVDEIKEKGTK